MRRSNRDDERDVERIGAALGELGVLDPGLAQPVDLKFFCGFSFAEIGAMRGVSERTARRHWDKARILLHGLIGDRPAAGVVFRGPVAMNG